VDPTNGFRLALSGGSGVLVPIEAAWTPVLGGDRPGYYKIGGWIETSGAQDLVRDDAGQLTIVSGQPGQSFRGRHGVYSEMSQQLTASPEGLDRKGLSMFFNFTQLDRRSSLIDNQTALGFTQTVPSPAAETTRSRWRWCARRSMIGCARLTVSRWPTVRSMVCAKPNGSWRRIIGWSPPQASRSCRTCSLASTRAAFRNAATWWLSA